MNELPYKHAIRECPVLMIDEAFYDPVIDQEVEHEE